MQKMLIIGTIIHVVIGLMIYGVTKWSPAMISLLFLFKEIGEAKYKITGSIRSIEKQFLMFQYVFEPNVFIQWFAPGLVVLIAIKWIGVRVDKK